MTKPVLLLLAALAFTACGAESKPEAKSAEPVVAESSALPSEPAAGAPQAPELTKSQIVEGLGLVKPKDEAWGEWSYTTEKGVTCGIEQILLGDDKVALYADAGDTVANNGVAGLVLVGDPYGESDDAGYAIEKACYDELTTKMATMVGG